MAFIRWYSGPVTIGFLLGLMINPVVAGLGFGLWLALVVYLYKRFSDNADY